MGVVLFDTSVLLLAIHPTALPPVDPATGAPLTHAKQRVDYLIAKLSKARAKVIVPTPTLSEVLVHAGAAANDYVAALQQNPFQIASFGTRAAIECADSVRTYGLKTKGSTRAKVKFDRQIVAIAKAEGVDTIYSDDVDIYKYGKQAGITVIRSYELERDPATAQHTLNLGESNENQP